MRATSKASDEGVQYDLLPILDGTQVTVNASNLHRFWFTFYRGSGIKIETRNILFVGAGAFEKSKPSDMAVELQGRLPIQVKMENLTVEDFKKILSETKHNLLVQ